MHYICKTFQVPVGHRLSKHKGLCLGLHGHNITAEVTLKSETLNKNDMVMDFSDVKRVVNIILNNWDHGMFLNSGDFLITKLLSAGICNNIQYFENQDPTAEVVSEYLFKKLNDLFIPCDNMIKVHSVKIWESDTAWAEYRED